MSYEHALHHLREGRKAGLVSVKFNLRGEVTLYKKLPEVIRAAKDMGYIDTMINTNGELLHDRFVEIKRAGLDTLIVSIGSTNREKYADVHQVKPEAFDKLHHGLWWAHLSHGKMRVLLNCHESIDSEFDFDWLRKKYPKFKIVHRRMMKREGTDMSVKAERTRKKMCPHMKRRLTVHSNGIFYPCCVSYNEPESLKMGTSFVEALKVRTQMISEYKRGEFRDECKQCTSQDVYSYG